MKNLLALSVAFTLSTILAQAQIEPGTIYIGATSHISYSSITVDGTNESSSDFTLHGKGSCFLVENLALGLYGGFSSTKFQGEKIESTMIGPFARYYVNGRIITGVGYLSSKTGDFEAQGSVHFELGYAAFLGDMVAIEPAVGYDLGLGNNNTKTISFHFGFGLYLNRPSASD